MHDIIILMHLVPTVSVPAVKHVSEDEGTGKVCATLYILDSELDITISLSSSDVTGIAIMKLDTVNT